MRKFVLIGGLPRSGTHLTRRILSSHSEIAMLAGEFNLFKQLEEGKSIRQILNHPRTQKWQLKLSELSDLYHQKPREVYITTLLRCAEKLHKPISGEKSPYNEFYYNTIREWFKDFELKFIHLTRHPLEAAASFKYAPFRNSKRGKENLAAIRTFSDSWRRSVAMGLARSYHDPTDYYLLQYENLINDPLNTVRKLCEFLGIDFEEEQMLLQDSSAGNKDNTSFSQRDMKKASFGFIYQSESRQHFLTNGEKEIISGRCGELADALGYCAEAFKTAPPKSDKFNIRLKLRKAMKVWKISL